MIAYLFKAGRKQRLFSSSAYPTEFFYGYHQLSSDGAAVGILDEEDLGLTEKIGPVWQTLSARLSALTGIHPWVVSRLLRPTVRARLNRPDVLIATTNTFGMSLALMKRLGLLRGQVIFLAMGICNLSISYLQKQLYGWLFQKVTLAVISKGEFKYLKDILGSDYDISYLPFGVDHRFWAPEAQCPEQTAYVLSIGNDLHRDYPTLVAAWKPEYPSLKIVTLLPVPAHASNIQVIAGDWRQQLLTDEEVRRIIQESRFVVLPVQETIQPSGQSACLQAMACGKAVILSDIQGLWDRDVMIHGENCLLVKPGSAEALQRWIETLLERPELAEAIGDRARKTVENHLNVDIMARGLLDILES